MSSFLAVWCAFICFATTIAYPKNDTKLWTHTFKVGETEYFIDTVKVNFDEAIKLCNSHNMQLVNIRDSSVNTEIVDQLNALSSPVVWTSGTKLAKSNDWIWLSNNIELITFFDWGTGEPSNNDGNEFCITINPNYRLYDNGHWNDVPCTKLYNPLCKPNTY